MKYLLVLAFVAVAWAVPHNKHKLAETVEEKKLCNFGAWGDWGKCIVSSGCGSSVLSSLPQSWSYPAGPTSGWDKGREAMTETMRLKLAEWSKPVSIASEEFKGRYPCVGGMSGSMQCENVEQLAFLDFDDLGLERKVGHLNRRGNDIWGWTDPLTGDEYAIVGTTGGTSFVRITDPENPVALAFVWTHTVSTTWRDVKVVNNHAFIGSEARDHGMQVFDLTRLRGQKKMMEVAEPDAHYNLVGNSHNVVSNEETGFIYLVGATSTGGGIYTPCKGGLHAVDVSDPKNPKFAGCYDEDGYTHDAQCVIYRGPDARYFGREVCFAFNEDSLTIVDVSDKSNMQMISRMEYHGSKYSHQGWLTEDMAMLLLDDELDEQRGPEDLTKTYIWNVHNLQNPVLVRTFYHPHSSIDHNQYVRGRFTYQANYESGLRIMYIDQENWDLREVAHFDIRPDRTTANFNGAWSVYPYFRSGTVVISSIDYGLFVVRPHYMAMEMEIVNPTVQATQTRQRTLLSAATDAICPLVETRPCKTTCD